MIGAGGSYPEQSTAPENALPVMLARRCVRERLHYPDHYPTSFARNFDFPYVEALRDIPEEADRRILEFYGGTGNRLEALETELEYENLTEEDTVNEIEAQDPFGFSPPYETYLGKECVEQYIGHIVSFLLDADSEILPEHRTMEQTHLLRLQELYLYAQSALSDAKHNVSGNLEWKPQFHPLQATEIKSKEIKELLYPVLSSLNPEMRPDLMGTTIRERTGYILEWMVPIMVVLEHYAKMNLTQGKEPPDHIKELAEQGIIFWSKLASSGAILENLSGRISDASFILLYPERYREEMTRTIHALFGYNPTNPYENHDLLLYLPSEIQNALTDEKDPGSLSSQLKAFVSRIEDKLIPQSTAAEVIRDRIVNELSDEEHKVLALKVLDLATSLDAGDSLENFTLAEIRQKLIHLGVEEELVEILRPQLRLRFKSAYRVMVKRNERRENCKLRPHLDEVDPSQHKEFFKHLDHFKKVSSQAGPNGTVQESERVRMLKEAPYLYTDVIGIRIIIPVTPTIGLARRIEREIATLGESKEPDLRRVAIPPDVNWPAAHYTLLGLHNRITLLGRKRTLTGPVEIQITGQTTVLTGASKSSSAHTQVHIGEYGPDNQFESTHQVIFPGRWLDVMASAAAANKMKLDDVTTYTRCTLYKATKSGNVREELPLDGVVDRGMYFVSLHIDEERPGIPDRDVSEQKSVPRIDQVIRALPFSSNETKDRVRPAIYNSIPERKKRGEPHGLFRDWEVLHLILRAHGSQLRVHNSLMATYVIAVELQKVSFRNLGVRSRGAVTQIANHIFHIDAVYRATGEHDNTMLLELTRLIIELYFNGEIRGEDLALAGNMVQKQLEALDSQ